MADGFLKSIVNRINGKLQAIYPGSGVQKPRVDVFPTLDAHAKLLDIPEGTEYIPRGALRGFGELVTLSIPSSVREIGERAFAGCGRLQSVTLREGLEAIGEGVFCDCGSLKTLVVPDSVLEISGLAFKDSGIAEPVLSASGDALYYCPAAVGEEFAVPEGVRRIGSRAFTGLPGLKRVHFPKSLERIDALAFVDCGLEAVTLPKGFRTLGERAFFKCAGLEIFFEEGFDPVRAAVLRGRAGGRSFLAIVRCPPPKGDPYWREREFMALAEECAAGKMGAAERMAGFFEERAGETKDEPFYACAANFWGFRAYERGSVPWRRRLEDFISSSPGERLSSPYMDETLRGTLMGETLNALGFTFFDPGREYTLAGLDGDGVVEVSSYESEDGPDEDGFGRETYYDWWYLDGDLRPAPGEKCLHSYSTIDRRISDVRARFRRAHDSAAQAVKRKN